MITINMRRYWFSVRDIYYDGPWHPTFSIWEWLRTDYGCRKVYPFGTWRNADIGFEDYDLVFENEEDLTAFKLKFESE